MSDEPIRNLNQKLPKSLLWLITTYLFQPITRSILMHVVYIYHGNMVRYDDTHCYVCGDKYEDFFWFIFRHEQDYYLCLSCASWLPMNHSIFKLTERSHRKFWNLSGQWTRKWERNLNPRRRRKYRDTFTSPITRLLRELAE